jgi:ATP diphosphatase
MMWEGSAMARTTRKTLPDLLAVMAALRTPGSGCPWDLAQTFDTIAPYTIEEAYEVAEAIAGGDRGDILEELGDLLLQVVYHARMAEEEGAFTFADVVDRIARKMLARHPHVFGTGAERAAGASPGFWERIKDAEKRERALANPFPEANAASGAAMRRGILADVARALPALTRAVKLQSKAARVGFDWPGLAPVLAKLEEEVGELQSAIAQLGTPGDGAARAAVAEELGDALFVMANLARHLQIDPEASLRAANDKFIRRFRHIEERLEAEGRGPQRATLAEMDRMWEEAKANERAPMPSGGVPARQSIPRARRKDAPQGRGRSHGPRHRHDRGPDRRPDQGPDDGNDRASDRVRLPAAAKGRGQHGRAKARPARGKGRE